MWVMRIADDEPIIADTLAIILNQAGFEARAVYSGEEALIMAKSFQPDLLISDVVMTGITGIAAQKPSPSRREGNAVSPPRKCQ